MVWKHFQSLYLENCILSIQVVKKENEKALAAIIEVTVILLHAAVFKSFFLTVLIYYQVLPLCGYCPVVRSVLIPMLD